MNNWNWTDDVILFCFIVGAIIFTVIALTLLFPVLLYQELEYRWELVSSWWASRKRK